MSMAIPHVDPHLQSELTNEQIVFFQQKGFLVIRNALCQEELDLLRQETSKLINEATNHRSESDYWFNDEIPSTWYNVESDAKRAAPQQPREVKRGIPFRIEYPVERSIACKALLAHSFILRAMEQLISPNFIPTWDSMVFKYPGEGVPIKWHRDASAASVDHIPAIDVGFYLDDASIEHDSCLYVLPGTQKWPDQLAANMLLHLSNGGFKKSGAIPVPVKAGDVILHNILVLHGSPACQAPLRRTVYFEYRDIDQELRMGPHKPEYIPLKQKVLLECMHARRQTSFDAQLNLRAFKYNPRSLPEQFDPEAGDRLPTLRYPHQTYFRADYKG